MATPKFIAGGCLCGTLRYRVDFPPGRDFTASSSTCQCTQCRKQTGSLFFCAHTISPASALQFIGPTPTLSHFAASTAADRGFCSACGSFLYWKSKSHDMLGLAVGSIDPLYLFGEGAAEQRPDDKQEQDVPEGGFGRALINGVHSHYWCANEIPGVTDKIPLLVERGERLQGD